jgi:ABC-2 type transport system permease protein
MFSIVAGAYVSLAVWLAVLGDRPMLGIYDRSGLITYYLGSSVISMLTAAWAGYFVAQNIRDGGLDRYLIRPWDYFHSFVINNVGEKITKLTILLPMALVLAWAFRADLTWSITWGRALLLPASVLMAAGISLLMNASVGLLAFWTADISGISTFYLVLEGLLTGWLIPLDLFPPALKQWVLLTPFRFMLSLPVEILVGARPTAELLGLVGVQLVWLLALIVLYRLLWTRGLRVYSSAGG